MLRILLIGVVVLCATACQRADVVGVTGAAMTDMETARKATRLALTEDRAMVSIERSEGAGMLIEGRYPDGIEVAIDLLPLSRSTTEVSVQVGHMGHGDSSQRLLDMILEQARSLKDRAVKARARERSQ
ncbi:MAG: DUF3568 family protein [Planctomycetota bacterium]|jgi:hypothetical protein|nr:DUF3568 family protein [Planctomycetota bacterium]